MITTPLDKILFMDIETVGCDETYKKLQKSNKICGEPVKSFGYGHFFNKRNQWAIYNGYEE